VGVNSRRRTLLGFVERHPAGAVFAIALVVRLGVAATYMAFTDKTIIPDEVQYLTLGDLAANHRLTSALWSGYGESLFHATATFMWPVTAAYWLLWPWRGFAIALVALAGAGTAAVSTRLSLDLLPRRWAVVAGLIVALLPSQVLWSSVVLRESFVWLLLALVGLATTRVLQGTSRLLPPLALALAACVGLGYLRQQTMIVAAWAVAGAAVVAARRGERIRIGAAGLAIALSAPLLSGYGVGGWSLLTKALPHLGSTRAYLSMNAESAFVPTTIAGTTVPTTTTTTTAAPATPTAPAGGGTLPSPSPSPGSGADSIAGRKPLSQSGSTRELLNSSTGDVYVVQEDFRTDIKAFPRGLLAVLLRPFPWDATESLPLAFARFENLLWYALYVSAAIGAWVERRRWRVLAGPLLLLTGIVLVAAVTQGNLGTAFRHRGQVLWALAVPAAVGLHHLFGGRRASGATQLPG
jgi:hypothetical protein